MTTEGSKKESLMEESILQNPSDMIGEARDQMEDHPEVLKNEVEEEEESSEELEDNPEEDPIEKVEQKQLEETILDPGLYRKMGEVPCCSVPECYWLSFYNCRDDQSIEPFEELSEASVLKQTFNCLEPEEEAEVNEEPLKISFLKQTSDCDSDGSDHRSGSVKSNDKKRCLDVACGLFTPLQCRQSKKKCKQGGSSSPELESGPSGLELNNDFVTVVTSIEKSASKESTGSSGKRRHGRWEPQSEGDGLEDYQACKRRKTRWSSDDAQLKMLGPLQLPDFTKGFLVGSEKDPEIQGLKAELFEINRKLQGPLHDERPEEERSVSPEPIYNDLGVRMNTTEARLYQELVQKRQNIISKLIKSNPTFSPPADYKPLKLFRKLYIPVKEYPEYNFFGLIIGPRGKTQKRIENETGAKILLRGKGSSKAPNKAASAKEDLHVYIEAEDKKSLDAAVAMVEKVLIPIEGRNEYKQAQLKELAMLNGTVRDESACNACGDEGRCPYACPNLQSTFKTNSCDTFSNSHLKTACPGAVLSPKIDSLQNSAFGFSFSSIQNRQSRPGKRSFMNNLYVGNLSQAIDNNRMSELFSPFGKITEAKVIKDRTTGISKSYGFVTFENAMDAGKAVTHLNGLKMDGKVLKVRIAELLSNTDSPGLNLLPQHSGPAGVYQNVTSQTDWSGPLHFMLHQTPFHDSNGMNLFSSTINSQHGDLKRDQGFTPPSYTSSPSNFSNSSNIHFSCNF